jgi:hypothetical protein
MTREFIVLLGCRAVDNISTWLYTPTLKREWNPVTRWLGWRWGIPLDIFACLLVAEYGNQLVTMSWCIGSLVLAWWNVCLFLKHGRQK